MARFGEWVWRIAGRVYGYFLFLCLFLLCLYGAGNVARFSVVTQLFLLRLLLFSGAALVCVSGALCVASLSLRRGGGRGKRVWAVVGLLFGAIAGVGMMAVSAFILSLSQGN
jgi:heme/copper-type cytochrome/quinol oxidase subunit 3